MREGRRAGGKGRKVPGGKGWIEEEESQWKRRDGEREQE